MQAAVDSKSKEDQGEKEEAPKPGSVEETIAKWIAPVRRHRHSLYCARCTVWNSQMLTSASSPGAFSLGSARTDQAPRDSSREQRLGPAVDPRTRFVDRRTRQRDGQGRRRE